MTARSTLLARQVLPDPTWFHLPLPVTGWGIAQNYVPLTE